MNKEALEQLRSERAQYVEERRRLLAAISEVRLVADGLQTSNEATLLGFREAYGALVGLNKGAVGQLAEGKKAIERATKSFSDITEGRVELMVDIEGHAPAKWRRMHLWFADVSWKYALRLAGWSAVAFASWIKAMPWLVEAIRSMFAG